MTNAPPGEARDIRDALRRSHERLRALVTPMTGDQLRRMSYASEWTIGQVLSHLGSGAEIGALVLRAALSGSPPPDGAAYAAVWEVWNAKSPEQHAADVLPADLALVEAFSSLGSDELAGLKSQIGPMTLDGPGMIRLRLGEHAVHTWDVAVAFDPAAAIDQAAVEQLIVGLEDLVSLVGRAAESPLRIHVSLSAPARELVLATGDTVTLTEWDGQERLPGVQMPAEALLRLVYGRLDPEHTPPISVDDADLNRIRSLFPGF